MVDQELAARRSVKRHSYTSGMRNVSLPQVLLILGVLAAVILAQRFAPGVSANVVSVVGLAVAWLMKSPSASDSDASSKVLPFALACALAGAVVACIPGLGPKEGAEILNHGELVTHCQNVARAAFDAGASPDDAVEKYDRCMSADGGVK